MQERAAMNLYAGRGVAELLTRLVEGCQTSPDQEILEQLSPSRAFQGQETLK